MQAMWTIIVDKFVAGAAGFGIGFVAGLVVKAYWANIRVWLGGKIEGK